MFAVRLLTIGIFTLLILICLQAQAQGILADTSNPVEIRIDPGQAYGADLSDVAAGVTYIPLETTVKSYFGKVDRLEVINDTFVIYDEETDAILLFNVSGKFVNKIKQIPQMKVLKDRTSLSNFSIDRVKKQVVILVITSEYKRKLLYFDLSGNYISTEDVPESSSFARFDRFYAIGNHHYAFANWLNRVPNDPQSIGNDKKYELLWGKSNETVYGRFMLFDFSREVTGDEYMNGEFYGYGDTSAYYVKSFHYQVYQVTPGSVTEAFNFVFPYTMTLPETFFTDKNLNGKRDAYLQSNGNYIFRIRNFYRSGDGIVFQLVSGKPIQTVGADFLYSLKTGMLFSLQNVLPDASNFHLPIFSQLNGNVQAAGKGAIYTAIPSSELLQKKEFRAPDRIRFYPPALKTFFNKATVKENPVIVKVIIKPEI